MTDEKKKELTGEEFANSKLDLKKCHSCGYWHSSGFFVVMSVTGNVCSSCYYSKISDDLIEKNDVLAYIMFRVDELQRLRKNIKICPEKKHELFKRLISARIIELELLRDKVEGL